MNADLIRLCPSCGTENIPSAMRCVCGKILAGVDIVRKQAAPAVDEKSVADTPATPQEAAALCAHEDCGQSNPPGTAVCLYCNRPLAGAVVLTGSETLQSLVNLPSALKARYRIVQPMPTRGAEAELLIVQALAGGPQLVAKIYRHGILPRREVQERIAKIPLAHRVNMLEEGVSDGYAFELMELCEHGSLRQVMDGGALDSALLHTVIGELATALRDVHAVGLVHRDLKPENILLRSREPLDLVLTDFSVSSILDVTQRFTGVARTLPYASPESLSGVIDFKSDFWAMGMIVLEGATGKHPFAGLSEAVVMHHLTTRNIDLSGVTERKVHKLLRGLLQRDPLLRWGADEVGRWLQNDTALPEPAAHGNVVGFNEPYHLGSELCYQPDQLATALSRNWKAGVADISNGLLLSWFNNVLKDQNVVRLLIEMRGQSSLSLDLQLLKLILHLAPGIPPVWRGETIELSRILTYANQALKGDQDAAYWLDNLYRTRVLEVYADAGNRQAADLVKRWHRALDLFEQAWKSKLKIITDKSAARDPNTVADFDQLMYGRDDLHRPDLLNMHARLLAMSYDNSWAERLRKRLLAELLNLSAQNTWVNDLGDPQQMDAASLLVLEALLPEAKKSVAHQVSKIERKRKEAEQEFAELREEIRRLLSHIRATASSRLALSDVADELRDDLNQYLQHVVAIRAQARSDREWAEFKKQALRPQAAASAMLEELEQLQQRRAISAGWFNWNSAGIALLVIIFLPGIRPWLIAAIIAFVAWRLLPDYATMQSIQSAGRNFPVLANGSAARE